MLLYILTFIIVLLLIPVPIKIKLYFHNQNISLYLYKFKIDLKKKPKKKINKKLNFFKQHEFDFNDANIIINSMQCNKFKPTLKINSVLNYGLSDASCTGIFYGFLSSINPIIYNILSIFFKIKKYNTSIIPEFETLIIKGEINSIISTNLAKIMYIAIILLKSYKTIKNSKNEYTYT